jgi:hypothetical protein
MAQGTMTPLVVTALVTVPITVIAKLVQQASKAVGASKLHAVPHCTVLLLAHVSTGRLVLTTVTVWLHAAVRCKQSITCQVRVKTLEQDVPLVTVVKVRV